MIISQVSYRTNGPLVIVIGLLLEAGLCCQLESNGGTVC